MHGLIVKTVAEQIIEDRVASADRARRAARLRRPSTRRERRSAPPSSIVPGPLRTSGAGR
jgi:hypothetical protein